MDVLIVWNGVRMAGNLNVLNFPLTILEDLTCVCIFGM